MTSGPFTGGSVPVGNPLEPAPPRNAECSVGQVGDREWWCTTHGCDAETCEPAVDAVSVVRDFRRDYDSQLCDRCRRYVRVKRDGTLALHRNSLGRACLADRDLR